MMKEKLLGLFALMSLGLSPLALADNKLCPIMIEDETYEDEVVEFEGKKVLFCCGTCIKLWNQSPKYYIKVMGELLPQFNGLDEIKVLPQKFCPVYPDRIVTPESPTVDVQGEKVYLFSKAAVRRWSRKPEDSLKKALAAGLLPQIEGNAKVAGKTNEVSK